MVQKETAKSKRQIEKRILHIENEGHFGNHKWLEGEIWELKFNDGRRIYYTEIPEQKIILILGGNKNGQDKDIKKATNLLRNFKRN